MVMRNNVKKLVAKWHNRVNFLVLINNTTSVFKIVEGAVHKRLPKNFQKITTFSLFKNVRTALPLLRAYNHNSRKKLIENKKFGCPHMKNSRVRKMSTTLAPRL